MNNKKTRDWFRGLFILVATDDPNFKCIAENLPIDSSPHTFTIANLTEFYSGLSTEAQANHLQTLQNALLSTESKSEATLKAIEKIELYLSHQSAENSTILTQEEIENKAKELKITFHQLDFQMCNEVYTGIHKLIATSINVQNHAYYLAAAIKLSTVIGNTREVLAYLNRFTGAESLTDILLNQAISFNLPTSEQWTPSIWSALFKKNKPNHPHDLFFTILPMAAEIEAHCKNKGEIIKPHTSLAG